MTRRINGDALQNRAGTAATGDVFTFDDAHADGGQWQAPGAGSASAAWPVGSIFLSAVATDPATLLGFGTWSAIGAGRVLIGDNGGTYPLGATGGAETSSHSHTSGTLTTDVITSHAHGAGTLAPSAHSGTAVDAHSGTAVASHGDHTHYINNAGSDATISAHSGTAVAAHSSHTHGAGTLVTDAHSHAITGILSHSHVIAAGQGSHQHGMAEGTTDGSGTYMDRSNAAAATTAVTDAATLPEMVTNTTGTGSLSTDTSAANISGSTGNESASLTHSVTQPSAHTLGGKTEGIVTGALTHSVTQPSNHVVTQPSAHTMSGSTASDGAHGHNVNSGSTGSTASSTVQPYLVVAIWQRTA